MKFILLLLLTVLLIPFSMKDGLIIKKMDRWNEKVLKTYINPFAILLPVIFWSYILINEYFGLLDNNTSSILTSYTFPLAILIGLSLFLQPNVSKWEKPVKWVSMLLLILAFIGTNLLFVVTGDEKHKEVKVVNKENSEVLTDENTPFTVPPETARNKMKKYFGDIKNVSFYQLGELTPQMVNGEPLYVAPIEVNGFFKRKAGYAPGYITMSGVNPNEEAVPHLDYKMKYIPSLFFEKNLERKIRKEEPNLIFFGEPKFEVNDEGKPFYTRTYGTFVSGRTGFVPKGIVLVDPRTGEITKYTKDQKPKFVDSVINHETASELNYYYGELVKGWINSKLSQKDVKLPTEWGTQEGVTPIFGKNDKLYYFTDFTSPKEGVDSALGYSLIDAETGVLAYYSGEKLKGVMDGSAAESTVDNTFKKEKWKGTMPVLYNVYGRASWVVPAIDDAGLVRAYAVVAGSNAAVVGTGSTQKEAFKKFNRALTRDMTISKVSKNAKDVKVQGVVLRVSKETIGESTTQFVLLQDQKKIYMISTSDFPYAMFTEPKDKVIITYKETGETTVSVSEFVNLDINK